MSSLISVLEQRTYTIADLQKHTGFDRRTIVYYIQQGLLPRAGRRGPNTRYPHECLLRLRFIRAVKDLQDQGQCGTITLRDIQRMSAALDAATLMAMLERGPPVAEVERLLASAAPVPTTAPPAAAPFVTATSAAAPTPAVAEPAAVPPAAAGPPAAPAAPPALPRIGGVSGPSGVRRSYGLADAGIRQRLAAGGGAAGPPPPAAPAVPPTQPPASAVPPAQPPASAPVSEPPAVVMGTLGDLLRELEVRPGLAGRRLAPGASEHWTEIPITSRVFLSVRGLSADDAPLADAAARELKKLLRVR